MDNSLNNDLECGDTNTFYIDLNQPVRVDEMEIILEQKDTMTDSGGWDCESINVTPMHAGVELTEPIGVSGNLYMDAGMVWRLEFQKALKFRLNPTINENTPVTHVAVRIKTGAGDYYDGTDYRVYIQAVDTNNYDYGENIDLDKYLYNDFENGDDDTYIVPLAEYQSLLQKPIHPTLGSLGIMLRHGSNYDWIVNNLTITPYYGNLQLTDPVDLGGDTFNDSGDFMYLNMNNEISNGNVDYKQYEAIEIEYETDLDDGFLADMKSLDAGVQWANLDALWLNANGRKLFFKLFKGFRPEIELQAPESVSRYDPYDIRLNFTGVWNGVGEERRNEVGDIQDMPPVEGTATITFINAENQGEYAIRNVPVKDNTLYLDESYNNTLIEGSYHIKVNYTADSLEPCYGDTEVTFYDAYVVEKKQPTIGAITYMVKVTTNAGKNTSYGTVTGSGRYEKGESVRVTATAREGYVFKEWQVNGQSLPQSRPSMTFTPNGNVVLVAVFEPAKRTIDVSAGTKGGSVAGGGDYENGEFVTVTASPYGNYAFDGWYENGEKVSSNTSYTFKVENDRTLTARFVECVYVKVSLPGGDTESSERGYRIIVDESDSMDGLFGNGSGREFIDDAGKEYKAELGSTFKFAVELEDGFKKGDNFKVRANRNLLLPDENGMYTVTVNEAKTIAIDGVIEIEHTAKPVITYEENGNSITFTATGDGEVTLYVNNKAVSNPYTLNRSSVEEEFSVYAIAKEEGKEPSEIGTLTDNSFGSSVAVPVIINDSVNGSVTVDAKYDAPGGATILTVTPDSGYVLDELIVESNGAEIEVVASEGKYHFTRPSSCAKVSATFKADAPNGWVNEGGKWAYYENGAKVTNKWKKDSTGWCYLGADGYMLTNKWVKDSIGWCYVGANGYMVYNKWVKDSVGWCHVGANGYMEYNKWVKDSVGWCHVGANGYMEYNKWIKDSVGWCHVGANGYMEYNKWVKDSIGWCHVGANGYMEYNKWVKDSVGWCYVGSTGYMVTNAWVSSGGQWYYMNASGYMVTGRQLIGGKYYTFNSSGVWIA